MSFTFQGLSYYQCNIMSSLLLQWMHSHQGPEKEEARVRGGTTLKKTKQSILMKAIWLWKKYLKQTFIFRLLVKRHANRKHHYWLIWKQFSYFTVTSKIKGLKNIRSIKVCSRLGPFHFLEGRLIRNLIRLVIQNTCCVFHCQKSIFLS